MKVTLIDPPAANSPEELLDLQRVIEQHSDRVVPESLQKRCDEDMDGMMVEFLADRGAHIDLENLSKVKLSIVPIISKLKHHYMRARPGTVADRLGIEFNGDFLDSAQTPSYPSGHTIQAYVCADYCSRIHPQHSKGLFMIAELVSQSRIDRGVHFPTDIEYGRQVAKQIADQVFGGQ